MRRMWFWKDYLRQEKRTGRIYQTLDFILAERQRELASELVRRTDLIRFGKFTKGHNWDWKNDVRTGADVDDHYNLFPIPETEFTNNPNLIQNEGY